MSTAAQQNLNEVTVKQAATSGNEMALRLSVAVDDQVPHHDYDADEYHYWRGHRDGIAWARDYATAGERRDVGSEQTNAVNVPGDDSPYRRGFVAGAEEVVDTDTPRGRC